MRRSFAALAVMAATLPLIAAAQGTKTQVTWYGQAAFVVKTPQGTVIAIDPWFSNPLAKEKGLQPPDKIDFILVTHGHYDHAGDVVALGKSTGAKYVGPPELAQVLVGDGFPSDQAKTTFNTGGTVALTDEVSVTMVPAVHSSGYRKDPNSSSQYGGNPVGFLLRVKGGPTFYHTGDTASFSDIQFIARRWPIDIMMACIGGHFTMDPIAAAQHVAWAGAKQVFPRHFGTFPVLKGTPAELQQALKAQKVKTTMVEMKVGETRAF